MEIVSMRHDGTVVVELSAQEAKDVRADLGAIPHTLVTGSGDKLHSLLERVQPSRRPLVAPAGTESTRISIATVLASGPSCTCRHFPAAHRADLHNEKGQVQDIEPIPSEGWAQMQHAKCTRCGWVSANSWLNFDNWVVQSTIAETHRDRWTDACVSRGDSR